MKTENKLMLFLLSFILISASTLAQVRIRTQNVIGFAPSGKERINGVALGIGNLPREHFQQYNGLSFELIGQGWLAPFLGMDDGGLVRRTRNTQIINGISCGLTLFNGKINGLTVSPAINTTYDMNGLKIGLINIDLYDTRGVEIGMVNRASVMKGLQIGLINRAGTLRGLQLGLVNINDSRTTLILNWPS